MLYLILMELINVCSRFIFIIATCSYVLVFHYIQFHLLYANIQIRTKKFTLQFPRDAFNSFVYRIFHSSCLNFIIWKKQSSLIGIGVMVTHLRPY